MAATYDLQATHGVVRSSRQMGALIDDIAENGIRQPIRYVEHDGVKYVVDGNHRLRAAKALGIRNVPVEEVSLPYRGYRSVNDLFGSSF